MNKRHSCAGIQMHAGGCIVRERAEAFLFGRSLFRRQHFLARVCKLLNNIGACCGRIKCFLPNGTMSMLPMQWTQIKHTADMDTPTRRKNMAVRMTSAAEWPEPSCIFASRSPNCKSYKKHIRRTSFVTKKVRAYNLYTATTEIRQLHNSNSLAVNMMSGSARNKTAS